MNDIHVILAECPGLGRVRICGCNSVHLSIGPVTLNLEPEAFAQVATLIRNAMTELAEITGAEKLSPFHPSSKLTH
jgi:hypothetical protein